jgi:cytochrome c biogenesis protein CcmG, thiol:disulfide interchange protein DsbE
LAAAALTGALLFWPTGGAPASPVPEALAFRLPEVRGGRLAATLVAQPGRPVILNFFAAWCDPCHAELPLLAQVARRDAGRVDVVGVDMQDNRDLATHLLSDADVTFPAGYDPDRSVSAQWQVDGLPVTVFIAPDGRVVDYHRGQLSAADLSGRVDRLLRVTGA